MGSAGCSSTPCACRPPVDGITTFVANVLAENGPMKALLLHRGARVTGRDGPELRIELPLDTPMLDAVEPGLERALRSEAASAPRPA